MMMGGVNINDAEYNLTLSYNHSNNNNDYIILNTRILCAKCTRMINEHNSG